MTKRKKLNLEAKRSRQAASVKKFAQQYARKAQPGLDPNDRSYDRRIEKEMKQMRPEILDALLRDGDE